MTKVITFLLLVKEKINKKHFLDAMKSVLQGFDIYASSFAFQVHDELVLEADPSVLKEAGLLLRMSMETAASLLGMNCRILHNVICFYSFSSFEVGHIPPCVL